MFLKRLEIQGFKSFADKIEMHYQKGITSVVGPNGSGKSNISDSIRWVLGEQSPKTLRGSKMEDIIFAGTTSRKPVGMAEVSITFDNTSQMMPLDYGEVTITRRVYRSGESEYYLNKSSCRLKDIRELLMDTGIGKEGYSIIGQGKIDEILSNKPEDRRQIFEEAAGIVKYRSRKEEAEKKLSSTKDNLSRVLDILHELENQLEPLRRQSSKAKQFKELKSKLLKLEVNLFIREIDKIDGELRIILEQLEVLKKSLEEEQKEKQIHMSKLHLIKEELKACDEEYAIIQNQYYQTENIIKEKEGQNSLSQEKIAHNNENIDRLKQEITRLETNEEQLAQQLKDKVLQLETIGGELDTVELHLQEKILSYESLAGVNQGIEKDVEESKGLIIDTLNEISDKKSELNSLRTLLRTMEERLQQVHRDTGVLADKQSLNDTTIGTLTEELGVLLTRFSEIQRDSINKANEAKEIEGELYQLLKVLEQFKGQLNHKISRKNVLEEMEKEHDGFNKSVKNILFACQKSPELGKGIHGVIADLLKVPNGYELAIETALGAAIQNIVSEDENDAKRLILHMKKNNLGRITILPISSIQSRNITGDEHQILKQFKDVEIALDVIETNSKFRNIFSNLLGRVLIVPNLDIGIEVARKLQHRLKIVTIDGDVINIGGSLTGGSQLNSSGSSSGILGRKRELEDLVGIIDSMNIQYQEMSENHRKLLSRKETTLLEVSRLNEVQQEKKIEEVNLRNKIQQAQQEKEQILGMLRQGASEMKQLKDITLETAEKITVFEDEIKVLENKIADTQNVITEMQSDLQKEKSKLDHLNKEMTQDRIRLASVMEQKKSMQQEINHIKDNMKANQSSIAAKRNEVQEVSQKYVHLKEALLETQNELNSLTEAVKGLEEKLNELRTKKNQLLVTESNESKVMEQMEQVINELQESMHKLDLKRTRFEIQQQNFYSKLWEDYELSYNGALEMKEEIEDIPQANRDIKKYKDEIKSLGNINLEAIDEYEKVRERYDFLKQQQEELNQAQESLSDVIKEMEKTMQQQFIAQFQIIKENFNQVFVKLFGGGKADLVLEESEDILKGGIDIIAQPPGKKLQNLSLLSGGERALTAISLLFAILLVKPSPFCILDEIEAALDDANVHRFAMFLKELSETTQFIVVTHRKGTMEIADVLYGVTMEEQGVSKLVSVKLTDNKDDEIAS